MVKRRRMNDPPRYWIDSPDSELIRAIRALLLSKPLSEANYTALRAYFRQWIDSPHWQGDGVKALRAGVSDLTTRKAITDWLDLAVKEGIDPL